MKEYKGKSGIYCIKNNINNKIYVGKTSCFYKRWYQYSYDFRHKRTRCINSYLLNSMIKYGFDNFEFTVLEFCEIQKCAERELFWMDELKSCDLSLGYNLRRDTSTNMIVSEATRLKITERVINDWIKGSHEDHSLKIKKSWENRSRKNQSELLTNVLTKYFYLVELPEGEVLVSYKELVTLGFKNVLANFSKKKTDVAIFKNVKITRKRVENES